MSGEMGRTYNDKSVIMESGLIKRLRKMNGGILPDEMGANCQINELYNDFYKLEPMDINEMREALKGDSKGVNTLKEIDVDGIKKLTELRKSIKEKRGARVYLLNEVLNFISKKMSEYKEQNNIEEYRFYYGAYTALTNAKEHKERLLFKELSDIGQQIEGLEKGIIAIQEQLNTLKKSYIHKAQELREKRADILHNGGWEV